MTPMKSSGLKSVPGLRTHQNKDPKFHGHRTNLNSTTVFLILENVGLDYQNQDPR